MGWIRVRKAAAWVKQSHRDPFHMAPGRSSKRKHRNLMFSAPAVLLIHKKLVYC